MAMYFNDFKYNAIYDALSEFERLLLSLMKSDMDLLKQIHVHL